MTPTKIRNEKLAAKIIKNLERRHIKGYYCPTAKDAVNLVSTLIADGSSVTWGGSMTIRDMGIPAALHTRESLTVYDRDLAADRDEAQQIYLKAFSCDYYLSSANALSEDGQIVNIDGTGNRVAAITFGPKNVIFVVGVNKVAGRGGGSQTRTLHFSSHQHGSIRHRHAMQDRRRLPQLQLCRLHL